MSGTACRAELSRQQLEALLDARSTSVDDFIRPSVERFASGHNALEIAEGFRISGHRTRVALREDACHVFWRTGAEPHCCATREQSLIGGRLRYETSASRQHESRIA